MTSSRSPRHQPTTTLRHTSPAIRLRFGCERVVRKGLFELPPTVNLLWLPHFFVLFPLLSPRRGRQCGAGVEARATMSAQGSESTHSASFPCPCDDFNTGAYPGKNPNGLSARPPQKHRTGYRTGGRSCTARLLPTESYRYRCMRSATYTRRHVTRRPRPGGPDRARAHHHTSPPRRLMRTGADRGGRAAMCDEYAVRCLNVGRSRYRTFTARNDGGRLSSVHA